MPITFDVLMFGNWEYQYRKKEPDEDGHYWIAMGHTKEKFDEGLVFIDAYEEYYGFGYRLEQRNKEEIIFPDTRTINVVPRENKQEEEKPKKQTEKELKSSNKGFEQLSLFDL